MSFIDKIKNKLPPIRWINSLLGVPVPAEPRPRTTCEWCERPNGCCDCQERIDCPAAGTMLHQTCGWCGACATPMFMCPEAHWASRRTR